MYVGGAFTQAGANSINNIARWNGSSWFPLNSGTNGEVYALAVFQNFLYVGGQFTTAGALSTTNLAKWDGSSWGIAAQLNAKVRTLFSTPNFLYLGGAFTQSGILSLNFVARWNGTNLYPLATGVDNEVYAVTVIGTDLFIGGKFSNAGNVAALYVAKWNGTAWSNLSNGPLNDYVYSLSSISSDLYVGGAFSSIIYRIAKWNGAVWSAVGNSSTIPNGNVNTITSIGNDLYIGGEFTSIGGSGFNFIGKWDGSTWSRLGSGMSDLVSFVGNDGNGTLFIGGLFTLANGTAGFNGLAKFTTCPPSPTPAPTPTTPTPPTPPTPAPPCTQVFQQMVNNTNGIVYAAAFYQSELYVGGSFTTIGGISANRSAKYTGSNWVKLGLGMDNPVYALAVFNNQLYFGGNFTTSDGFFTTYISRFNGTTFSTLFGGFELNGFGGTVAALKVSINNLYIGGKFSYSGCTNIVKWDGNILSGLGSGTDSTGLQKKKKIIK